METINIWVIVYLTLVLVHMIVISLFRDKTKEAERAEHMLQILCLIPVTWIMLWTSGLIYLWEEKMKPIQNINKKLDSKAAVDLSRNFARKYKKSKPNLPKILKT